MGIVYSPAALLHKRLAKQSAVEKRKHNSSSVNLAGYTRDQIKKRVRESAEFTAREKALLAYVADQDPVKFVLAAKTAQDALSISEYQWVGTRKKLEAKCILMKQMVPLSDGSHHWFLDFDFSPLSDSKYDAPVPREIQGKKAEPSIYKRAGALIPQFLGDIHPKAQPAAAPLGAAGGNVYGGDKEERRDAQPEQTQSASQAAGKNQKPMQTSPAPQGGRAVLHAPRGSELMSDQDFSSAKEFFNWLGRNGVLSLRLAAQVRKKSDGKRGAPLGFGKPGKGVAEGSPVRTAAASDLAQSLLARLEHMGKRRLELVTAAAEDSQGFSKSILLDDLESDGVRAIKMKWRGPGAILETSPGNYQAILILSEPMDRTDRKSITGQLVTALGADDGATGSLQLHRLPGSVNYKMELDEPFACLLVEFFNGKGEGVQPIKPVAKPAARSDAPVARPGVVRPMRKRKWSTPAESTSQEAFRFAVELLDAGSTVGDVEAALSAPEWLRHHDRDDWPKRTAENARAFRDGDLYGRGGARHA
jgi:hypothetical protein